MSCSCCSAPLLKSLTALAPNISVRFFALEPSAAERLAAGELDFVVLPAEIEPSLPSRAAVRGLVGLRGWSGHSHTGSGSRSTSISRCRI